MRKWRRIFLIVAVLGVTAFAGFYFLQGMPSAVASALRQADSFELLSLDPEHNRKDADFHGYKVLGRTLITDDPATRKLLYNKLQSATRSIIFPMKCFNPRHGISVTAKGRTYDLLICFECLQVYVYEGDKHELTFTVKADPQPVFDQVLRDAGLPLAPKAY